MEEFAVFINTVGFPVVACAFMYKQNEKLTSSIIELSSTLSSIDTRLEHLEKEVDK